MLTIRQFLAGKFEDGRTFKLREMRILRELEGSTWEDLQSSSKWSDAFLNQTIRTAILRGWENEDVLYEIFQRLNSGSVKLSPMELRTSLHPGPFLKAIVKWTETPRNLHKLLRLKRPDKRMADVELVVRYLGFSWFSENYRGNLKAFLDDTCKELNEEYESDELRVEIDSDLAALERAIALDMEIFGTHACRKWKDGQYDSRFNRAVFDVQIASLSDPGLCQWIGQSPSRRRSISDAFIELSSRDASFVEAVETTTKSLTAVGKRFEAWFAAVRAVSGVPLETPAIGNAAPH